jgi:rsbT co-antagonist protein RsbR
MELPDPDAARPLRLPAALYEQLIDGLHEGVFVVDAGVFRFVNVALARLLGGLPADIVGQHFTARIAPEDLELVARRYRRRMAGEAIPETYEYSLLHLDGERRVPVFVHTHTLPGDPEPLSIGTIVPLAMRSVVARGEAETAAAMSLGEEEGERLSIPVLALHARALVVPIVGHLNAGRARRLMDRLLAAIAEHGAREVIVDITGVPVVDERVAGYLVRTARAVRLLGARLTLAGVSPAIARALVTLGVELGELGSTGSLEDAWRSASARLAGHG